MTPPGGRHVAYIGLGSNLDDPVRQVSGALRELAGLPGSRLLRCSSLYRSQPLGPPDQPDYVNAAAAAQTDLLPVELLRELQLLERRHGRRRGVRWGPRTLDLDLLLFDELVLDIPALKLPHPELTRRAFVLVPLAEIAPAAVVPGHGPVGRLAANCDYGSLERIAP
jgi:2-amino-4-hydroxy-6-hydroxymethyldihydropteridine diphosphokinase